MVSGFSGERVEDVPGEGWPRKGERDFGAFVEALFVSLGILLRALICCIRSGEGGGELLWGGARVSLSGTGPYDAEAVGASGNGGSGRASSEGISKKESEVECAGDKG